MKKRVWALAALVSVVALGYAGFRIHRGPTCTSTAWGGAVAADVLPEFYADEHMRWVNGEPQTLAAQRGHPVLIEVWAPG